jgi:AcrR family transcriptional regulator
MPPRARLDVDIRREQLIELGKRLFSTRPYEEIQIGEIAREAGISKGLLYHYFPSKRDFYAAVMASVLDDVAEIAAPEPDLPPLERLRAAIDSYLDYVEGHVEGYLSFHRGGMGSNEEVRALFEEAQSRQAARILAEIHGSGEPPELLRLAVRGWLNFMVTVVLQWLDDRAVEREKLRDLVAYALINVATSARQADPSIELAAPPAETPRP